MKYVRKRDGGVSEYPAHYRKPSDYKRGPHLYGHAKRRADSALVDRYLVDVGRMIRDKRLELQIPVAEVAAAAGISACTLHCIENGGDHVERRPGSKRYRIGYVRILIAISLALGVMPSELVP